MPSTYYLHYLKVILIELDSVDQKKRLSTSKWASIVFLSALSAKAKQHKGILAKVLRWRLLRLARLVKQ